MDFTNEQLKLIQFSLEYYGDHLCDIGKDDNGDKCYALAEVFRQARRQKENGGD